MGEAFSKFYYKLPCLNVDGQNAIDTNTECNTERIERDQKLENIRLVSN